MFMYLTYIVCVISIRFYCCDCQLVLPNYEPGEAGEGQVLQQCGSAKDVFKVSPLIINGEEAPIGTFPWHAGLYYRSGSLEIWDQKCGGSLITDQLILTAAHCVAGRNISDIRVALGKAFRSWHVQEDYEQKRNVSKISYPEEFAKPSFYFDLALLLLDEKIKTNRFVMPVCTKFLGNSNFLLNKELLVAGWGQTKNVQSGSSSETLLYNDVTFVPKPECKKHVPTVFAIFDKFCTMGNDSEYSIAQHGDSGGGLTVIHEGLHYIYGIVSIKLTDVKITFFTNITWATHLSWIENELRKFDSSLRLSENSDSSLITRLPEHPVNGAYTSNTMYQCVGDDPSPACSDVPGTLVREGWMLRYTCNVGFNQDIPFKASVCKNGVWRNKVNCIRCGLMSPFKSKMPWAVDIYRRVQGTGGVRTLQFGGTLITPRIVMTGAESLTDRNRVLQPTEISVLFDTNNQYTYITAEVKEVVVPEGYNQTLHGSMFIGLLHLMAPVTITSSIMPACVDWSNTLVIPSGTRGTVVWTSAMYQFTYMNKYMDCVLKYPGIEKGSLSPYHFCGRGPIGTYYSGDGYTVSSNGLDYVIGVAVESGTLQSSEKVFIYIEIKFQMSFLLREIERLEY